MRKVTSKKAKQEHMSKTALPFEDSIG